jgi:hypothetical protein
LIAFVSARVHAPGASRMERMNDRVADEALVYVRDSLLPGGQTGSILPGIILNLAWSVLERKTRLSVDGGMP